MMTRLPDTEDPLSTLDDFAARLYDQLLSQFRAELAAIPVANVQEQSARRHKALAQAVPAAVAAKAGKFEFHCPRCRFWRPFGTQQGAVTFGVGHMLNLHPEEGRM